MSPVESAACVAVLQAAYPGARWSEPTVELYESMLAELGSAVARDAIMHLVRTSRFLPSIAEVLDAAADVAAGPVRPALAAWGDVGRAVRRVGYVGAPRFSDALTAECVRAMGWRELCLGESSEASDRARFCELYTALARQRRVAAVCEPGRLSPAEPVRELLACVGGSGA